MSKLIDSHVSTQQAKKAIDALLKHNEKHKAKKEENELLGPKEEVVWLNVAVKKVYPEKKLKPFSIPLARPIIDPRTTSICLITKDPQREYKDLLEAQNVKFISRVVGVTKLKGKFKPFEARRQLMQDHGVFLVDERVVPMMPKLLGKIFFKAKKQPVPVNLQKKDVKAELEHAVSSTYMHQNQGTCTSIKIAPTTFTTAQVLANLTTALPEIVKHIKGGWENVQSLYIKTSGSAALPIWSCDVGSRWDGLGPAEKVTSEESESEDDGEEDDEEDDEEDQEEPAPVVKGKKRAAPTAPVQTASKKPKAVESVPAKSKPAKEGSSTKGKAKILEVVMPKPKAKTAPAKQVISETPNAQESSGSEFEPEVEPEPERTTSLRSATKKPALTRGFEQKKAKLLATKGSLKGSKTGIVGNKKVSAR